MNTGGVHETTWNTSNSIWVHTSLGRPSASVLVHICNSHLLAVETLKDFAALGDKARQPKYLRKFLETHFKPPGGELEECYPADWRPNPSSLARVQDPDYRRWALALHRIWRQLCRQVSQLFGLSEGRLED